jgi:hypothetical protein
MSNPNVPFYQFPTTGAASNWQSDVGLPDYWGSVFKPTEAQQKAKGTNTTTGGRNVPSFDYTSAGNALPGMDPGAQQWIDVYRAMSPIRMQEQAQASQLSQQLTEQQLASLYPYLSQAARESTERNLRASQQYREFSELLPSSMQAIAASQQNQASQAAGSQAALMTALANLKGATRGFKGYRGQTFGYG